MTDVDSPERTGEVVELELRHRAAELIDVPLGTLKGWDVHFIRDDGCIDANIPLQHLRVDGVPTDPDNIDYLKDLIDVRAEETGGTGQRDPIAVGHVPGEGFFVLDGFHRHEVQLQRGVTKLQAIVQPNMTYEEVVKLRLVYAKEHKEIVFARQVEWMQSVWERSELSELLPNVLSAFRTVQNEYERGRTDDGHFIAALTDDQAEQVRKWVRRQSKEWGYTPRQIREKLAQAESFDPDLMKYVYQRPGAAPEGRITLKHVQVITETYGLEYDIQGALVELITAHSLNTGETEDLINRLEDARIVDEYDVQHFADDFDFSNLIDLKAKATRRRSKEQAGQSTDPQFDEADVVTAIADALPRVIDRADTGEWTEEDSDNAHKIVRVLTAILARHNGHRATAKVEEAADTETASKTSQTEPKPKPNRAPIRPVIEEGIGRPLHLHKLPTDPEVPLPEKQKFQIELRNFLNGLSENFPDINDRRTVRWAQEVTIHESFTGEVSLLEEVQDSIDEARKYAQST